MSDRNRQRIAITLLPLTTHNSPLTSYPTCRLDPRIVLFSINRSPGWTSNPLLACILGFGQRADGLDDAVFVLEDLQG